MNNRYRPLCLVIVAFVMTGMAIQPASASDEPIAYTSYAKFPQPGGTDYPYYTTGKLYVSFPGFSRECSASSIGSENQSVFVTAAHCVYDFPTRTWGSNTMFVPAQYYGSEPFGRWTIRQYSYSTGYINNGDADRDIMFLVANRNASGQTLHSRIGWNGWVFGRADRDEQYHMMGYPAGAWGGERLMNCDSKYGGTINQSAGEDGTMVGCDWIVGGASGSPLVKKFSGTVASFTNQQVGVIQGRLDHGQGASATYFGNEALQAFNLVRNA